MLHNKNKFLILASFTAVFILFGLEGCSLQTTTLKTSSTTSEANPEPTTEQSIALAVNTPTSTGNETHNETKLIEDEFSTLTENKLNLESTPENKLLSVSDTQNDIWQRLRSGMTLASSQHKRTKAETNWYAKHPEYINRTIDRARPYIHLIIEEVEKRGLPSELVLLPIVESAFQPFAYSHGRAAGIWQFIPGTGRVYGLKQDWWYDGRRDIEAATKAALTYLEDLNKQFDGDWLLALAAYNSGQGTVKKAIRKNLKRGRTADFWSLKLPRETRAYVPKLLAISAIFKHPDNFGIQLKSVEDKPYLSKVDTGSQIDLALAAELADISVQELYTLNPAFNRWATSPDGPHSLLLPIEHAHTFTQNLEELPASKRIKWARHKIREGQTLGHIANKYHTTVSVLKRVNKIRGNMIRAGRNLIIPVAIKNMNSYSLSAVARTRSLHNKVKNKTKTIHKVRKGDTLWDLSVKYRTGVRKIASWNGIAPRDLLREGQKLVIWSKPRSASSSNISPNLSAIASNNLTQKINYIVRNGDSLSRISQKFRVRVSELRQWNALPRNKYLQPGQKITLYVDVTRQSERI